ncbi:uncharacterized protein LOC143923724 isoform X2 [Lithobates pipiens]
MDYRRTLLPLFLLYYTDAALKMTGPSTHRAMLGSDTQIPCKFTADKLPVDPKFFAVIWYYAKNSILSYDNTVMTTDPRYSINKHQALNGIADLIISNTSISDGGVYICSVTDSPFRMEQEVTVNIQAIPNITITNKLVTNNESVLQSVISGFYPVDIDIKWLRDGEILDKVIVENPQRDPDGTYHVRSSVTITPTEEDRERIFSCRVQHKSLTAPLQEDFQLVYGAIPLISIVSTKVQRNIKNTLICKATGFFPPQIKIMWYRNGKVLKNQFMEKPQEYGTGTYQVTSTLTITPTNDDQNQIFSCRVQHDSLQEPLREDFQLIYEETSMFLVILICSIVVALLIIAVVVSLCCWKHKHKRSENQSANITRGNHPEHSEQLLPPKKAELLDPEIGEIKVPELTEGELAELECKIYNYATLSYTVLWLQKLEDKLKFVKLNKAIKRDETSKDQNTYIATLTLSDVQMSDDGSEYICRVQCSDAWSIIERSTGPIRVKANQSANRTRRNGPEHLERLLSPNRELPDPEFIEFILPKMIEGEPDTLKCEIRNLTKSHTVNWHQRLKKERKVLNRGSPVKRDETSTDQNTFIVTLDLPAVQMSDDGTEYVCEVEFPGALPPKKPAIKKPIRGSTGPLQVKVKQRAEISSENSKSQTSDLKQICKSDHETSEKHKEDQPQYNMASEKEDKGDKH